jgi:hypothetical protein
MRFQKLCCRRDRIIVNKALLNFSTGLIVVVKYDDPDFAGVEDSALILGAEKNSLVISLIKDNTIGYIKVDNIILVLGTTDESVKDALNIIANWKGSIKPVII